MLTFVGLNHHARLADREGCESRAPAATRPLDRGVAISSRASWTVMGIAPGLVLYVAASAGLMGLSGSLSLWNFVITI